MTETARALESTASASLYVAYELGSTKWVLACTTERTPQRPRLRQITAGDLAALIRELGLAKVKLGLPADAPVRSCYEAGRDGFWLHRWLTGRGVRNVVVDSSSIEVNRRARHAKTDRLDASRLLALLRRWVAGEPRVWSVVHVPTPEAEAARQLTRELATVRRDRAQVRSRIQGLLATQGIRGALTRRFAERLPELTTGDGRPLPPAFQERLAREWMHLQAIEARRTALETAQERRITAAEEPVGRVAQQLCRLRGVGEVSASLYSAELFATRTFQNPRQLGALTGLVPVPYRSDQRVQDQGISKAGRAELRRVSVQLAWCWLRWQPDSALAGWFAERFGRAGGRSRRIGIVAVARRLVIALWRFVEHGVVPAGAHLKPIR
jgi:transposase